MVWINFNHETKLWEELSSDDEKPDTAFFLDGIRRKYLDQVKKDLKNDLDHLEIIFGAVGSGKSTLGRLDCRYVSDERFHPSTHIIRSVDDIKPVIKNAKKREAVLIDEGSGIFAGTDSMTKKTKYGVYVLDVCRQKNLFLVLCAPNIHRLSAAVAIDRAVTCTRTYIHAETNRRGRFAFYGKTAKEKLYRYAKANYGSLKGVRPKYRGRFSEDKTFTEEYLRLKDETLDLALDSFGKDKDEIKAPRPQEIIQDYRVNLVKNNMELPVQKLADILQVSKRTLITLRNNAKKQIARENQESKNEKQLNSVQGVTTR